MRYLKNLVSASILSADMLKLGEEVRKLEKNNVDMLHFDVMDGIFVNNITYGIPILNSINKITDITLDVHLMISEPLKYVNAFADNGADIITFHIESKSDPLETINAIKQKGVKAAIALKPNTPVAVVEKFVPYLDMILIMTVEPGFGGQKFIESTVSKIRDLRKFITDNELSADIQVDGGIDAVTSQKVKSAGANVLVSGSYLFKSENMSDAVKHIRE
ncbi:MAG: ribulose-phosphate 3-epimerase [Ruminococcus sp.]|jgi:ribulose-phosphate 3-epimerase|nr:ribulose-phosphate 3-epimerase [Ruminococcus sp.]